MNELYAKHTGVFKTVFLFIFWALFFWLMPAFTEQGINPDYSAESAVALVLGFIAIYLVLTVLGAAWGSLLPMFIGSPIFKRPLEQIPQSVTWLLLVYYHSGPVWIVIFCRIFDQQQGHSRQVSGETAFYAVQL
jgi:uncharacterized membrane protein YgcG